MRAVTRARRKYFADTEVNWTMFAYKSASKQLVFAESKTDLIILIASHTLHEKQVQEIWGGLRVEFWRTQQERGCDASHHSENFSQNRECIMACAWMRNPFGKDYSDGVFRRGGYATCETSRSAWDWVVCPTRWRVSYLRQHLGTVQRKRLLSSKRHRVVPEIASAPKTTRIYNTDVPRERTPFTLCGALKCTTGKLTEERRLQILESYQLQKCSLDEKAIQLFRTGTKEKHPFVASIEKHFCNVMN